MKVLKIGGKEYTFEFTFEASLHNECIERTTHLMACFGGSEDKSAIKSIITGLSNLPRTAMSMFYAGLLENHGETGDGTILSEKDAKKLIKQYFNEHKDDGNDNFFAIMELMIDCMGDDGFFKRIGLEQLIQQTSEQKPKKEPKTPQDHKPKTTKATEK